MESGELDVEQDMVGGSMFDLNAKITEWRISVLQKEAFRINDVDELEGHLREEIALFDSIIAIIAFLVLFIMLMILNIRHRKLTA